MKDVVEGSNVYWYPGHRALCATYIKWQEYLSALVDVFFFAKDTLSKSCVRGKTTGKLDALLA